MKLIVMVCIEFICTRVGDSGGIMYQCIDLTSVWYVRSFRNHANAVSVCNMILLIIRSYSVIIYQHKTLSLFHTLIFVVSRMVSKFAMYY
jgi:hypothetical protein